MTMIWLKGLLAHRSGRLIGTSAGIALTVMLIALIGIFLIASSASMTRRATAGVPVDWQIQVNSGANADKIKAAIAASASTAKIDPVSYADVRSFTAKTGDTVQTTGAGKVVGFEPGYVTDFPGQFRALLGPLGGVMLSQQTAANLHVTVGATISVQRVALPAVDLKVAAIVDLPNADAMFQAVGVPPGAAPTAPPDNVALIPLDQWHGLFDPQAAVRPDTVRLQFHVLLDRGVLPGTPDAAYSAVIGAGHNLESRIAGDGILGNTLAARLDAVRGDALYAKVLFLFLGAPGVAIAILLTIAVAASGRSRRQRDQALLRTRGASNRQLAQLAGLEAIAAAVIGSGIGIAVAAVAARFWLDFKLPLASSALWLAFAAGAGLALALSAILLPAALEARNSTVAMQRQAIGRMRTPLWQRAYLDIILLVLSGLSFWQSASKGYTVVLAPEGVPAAAVDYMAFLAPLLFWFGAGLLTLRLGGLALGTGRHRLAVVLAPIAGPLAGVVAASLSRQSRRITAGIALTALAFAFAVSTAIFNTTYAGQAVVDAQLTNGADVSVIAPPFTSVGTRIADYRRVQGVAAAEPMQHRLAYVGADLQDIYGIDPSRLGASTNLSNAFFKSGDALGTLSKLGMTPDGVLVSEETIKDFQLQLGDTLNLRLQSALDHQYHVVPFKLVGVVREFPTAPRDSFLVANANYIAKQTGSDAAEIVLVRASGDPKQVADRIAALAAGNPVIKVRDIGSVQKIIGSSLTAVDLAGLTQIELAFAFLAIAAASGLILALGLADRRRTFALLDVLGARPGQLASFLWSEALLVFAAGAVIGGSAGVAIAWMLTQLLTGVFDPPPERLAMPYGYLAMTLLAALLAVVVAVRVTRRTVRTDPLSQLRDAAG